MRGQKVCVRGERVCVIGDTALEEIECERRQGVRGDIMCERRTV